MTTLKDQVLGLRIIYGHKIPDGFSISRLDELADISYGISDAMELNLTEGVGIISLPNVSKDGTLDLAKTNFINPDNVQERDLLKDGDLLFNWRNGSKDHLGKTAIFNRKEVFTHVGFLLKIRCNLNVLNPEFLYAYINYIKNRGYFLNAKIQVNNTFNKEELSEFPIIFPKIEEQKKIAKILSSYNHAIEKITQIIDEKEKCERAFMLSLLNGKSRFPGFKDRWVKKKLGQISEVIMGQSPSSDSYNELENGLPLIQGNADIKNRETRPRQSVSEITKVCEIGDIIMTVRAPVGAIAKSKHKACIGRGVCAIRSSTINQDYLYWLMIAYEDKWTTFSQGSTFTAVNGSDIRNIVFSIPSERKEQDKVANFLTATNTEIQSLKKQLYELKIQKKGVTRQLLTGKIKVKV